MRINRWLSSQGHCSRREADAWIEAGRVSVNGALAALGVEIGPEDKVALDGRPLYARRVAPVVIAYNKPVGIECTSNRETPNNIIDAVAFPERLVHVGRLDVMSEGLIFLTNQGDIVQHLLAAENGHEREYEVTLSTPISDLDVRRLAHGIDIGDERGPTLACKVVRVAPEVLRMTLVEGRNRQIRRMAEAIGNHVRRLVRVRIMHVRLGAIPRGAWRHLTPTELRELYQQLGLERPRGGPLKSETPRGPRGSASPDRKPPSPRGRAAGDAPRDRSVGTARNQDGRRVPTPATDRGPAAPRARPSSAARPTGDGTPAGRPAARPAGERVPAAPKGRPSSSPRSAPDRSTAASRPSAAKGRPPRNPRG
jgi:23S rRNA pseudouridine2604 synthase